MQESHYSKNRRWRKRHLALWHKERNNTKRKDEILTGGKLGIGKGKLETRVRWNEQELSYLKENAKSKTIIDIALYLGRSYIAVQTAAHRNHVLLLTTNKRRNKLISQIKRKVTQK